MKTIVTKSKFAIMVDDEDFEELNKYTWHIKNIGKSRNTNYAARKTWTPTPGECYYKYVKGKRVKFSGIIGNILMHRQIMNFPEGLEIDHIDGNGLNNQKSNLRIVTHQQNMCNVRMKRTSKTGHQGISYDTQTKKWRSSITRDGKFHCLGRFENIEDAIMARKNAEKGFV
jgi:HNH endonuclease